MKSYSKELKQQVIERYFSGEASASILTDTGIPKSTFYSWVIIDLFSRMVVGYKIGKKPHNKHIGSFRKSA